MRSQCPATRTTPSEGSSISHLAPCPRPWAHTAPAPLPEAHPPPCHSERRRAAPKSKNLFVPRMPNPHSPKTRCRWTHCSQMPASSSPRCPQPWRTAGRTRSPRCMRSRPHHQRTHPTSAPQPWTHPRTWSTRRTWTRGSRSHPNPRSPWSRSQGRRTPRAWTPDP